MFVPSDGPSQAVVHHDDGTPPHPRVKTPGVQVFKNLMCLCDWSVAFQHTEELSVADIQCCPLPVIKQERNTQPRETTIHEHLDGGLDE